MKQKDLQRAEFWISTILYAIAVIILISNTGNRRLNWEYYNFKENHMTFSYLYNYFLPKIFQYSVIYISFLGLNFIAIPAIIKKQQVATNVTYVFILFIVTGFVISIARTYSDAYLFAEYIDKQSAYNRIFFKGFSDTLWIFIAVSGYVVLKEFVFYLIEENKDAENATYQIKIDVGFGLAFWFVGLLLLVATSPQYEVIVMWTLIVFAGICQAVYAIHFYLPKHQQQEKRFIHYFGYFLLIALFLAIPVSLIMMLMATNVDWGAIILCFHFPTQLIVTMLLAWYIFKNRSASNNQIFTLKKELGKSDASLSFLQSQINPHFLFNALNTLYGTALQENAERTGEGIQKLGDMMRFMLHENVQDKISLTRDVDYLENYIALQKLRTSRSGNIIIDTQIDEQLNNLEITPMLLIPFVENAFKHGISLQHPSHIKVTLQTKENTLYFDVHNSIHIKPDNDPEKLKSGIGLLNVKQRLALLYPGKHELIIRESAKEFFIHLTIKL